VVLLVMAVSFVVDATAADAVESAAGSWLLQGRIHSCEAIGLQPAIARCSRGQGTRRSFRSPVHPHMLRHACGSKLANDGQDTRAVQHHLGRKNIQHTVRYTELSPGRFKSFGRTEEKA
jgi:integrase